MYTIRDWKRDVEELVSLALAATTAVPRGRRIPLLIEGKWPGQYFIWDGDAYYYGTSPYPIEDERIEEYLYDALVAMYRSLTKRVAGRRLMEPEEMRDWVRASISNLEDFINQ